MTNSMSVKKEPHNLGHLFRTLAVRASTAAGSHWAFLISILAIVIWALTGPMFHYSDTWQLVVNTATTIITFLMVFLIQNTQNREVRTIQLKLDEMIRGTKGPRTHFVDLEDLSDEELDRLYLEFQKLHRKKYPKNAGLK